MAGDTSEEVLRSPVLEVQEGGQVAVYQAEDQSRAHPDVVLWGGKVVVEAWVGDRAAVAVEKMVEGLVGGLVGVEEVWVLSCDLEH